MGISLRNTMASCSIFVAASFPVPLLAQTAETQADAAANPEAAGIADIVVTAQRREENLQKVPISVVAFSGDMLEKLGVKSVNELSAATPGLIMTQQRNAITPYLRGVGTASAVGAEEGTVPVYLDGVLISSLTAAAFSLPSVARVEVLKGPQGTLFGRNAVGGLVNVVTFDPSFTTSGSVMVGYGNFDTLTASAYATTALSDNVAMDVTAFTSQQGEGWGRNVTFGFNAPINNRGIDALFRKETLLRAKVLVRASEKFQLIAAADYQMLENSIGLDRNIRPGAIGTGGARKKGGFYDSQSNLNIDPKAPQWGMSLKAKYEFDFATLTSTTAYRRARSSFNFDQDGTELAIVDAPEKDLLNTFQQELLLTGDTGPLDWTAGLFYYHSMATFDTSIGSINPVLNFRRFTKQVTDSYAAFGQVGWHIDDATTFTAGLRYTKDKREFSGFQVARPGHPAGAGTILVNRDPDVDPTARLSNGRVTWRLSLDRELGRNAMVFASYNRGFKSGVFNQTNPASNAVSPETLDAYEVGLKSLLFDRSLRFNVSLFYNDYSGIQLTRSAAGVLVTFNAPGAKIYGADAEIIFSPPVSTGKLEFRLGGTYLHGRYKEFLGAPISSPAPAGGNIVVAGDATGNDTIKTPPYTFNVAANYELPISFGKVSANVNYYRTARFYWEVDNRLRQGGYGLLNAQFSLASENDHWLLSVFGRNLTKTKYYVDTTGGNLGDLGSPGAPRTYGASVTYKF